MKRTDATRVLSRSVSRTGSHALLAGALASALTLLLSCTTYAPKPLPTHDDLAAQVPPADAPQGPAPLDMDALATLAVLNNPTLKAAHAKLKVAAAQAFAAGILPEPQFNASFEHPTDQVTSPRDPRYPEYNAYGLGLAIDLQALLTHSSTQAAASAAYAQAQADLLWQEWQTVAEVRTQYVAQSIAAARLAFLAPAAEQYALAADRSARALAQANVTLEQADADQAALAAIRTQEGTALRNQLKAEQSIRGLVGVRPDVVVPLQSLPPPPMMDRAQLMTAVHQLPRVRPDLRALQEGYRSEEAQVRAAVLSQFPNIVVGVTHARDVSDVHTFGGTVSLDLPLFDRNRGHIAIQRATRAQLRAEYLARLDQATADIWQLWHEMNQLSSELADLDRRLPLLERSVESTQRSLAAGNIAGADYLGAVNAYLSAQASRFDLQQAIWIDSIALATLTGTKIQVAQEDRTTP